MKCIRIFTTVFAMSVLLLSCEKDDFTGHSRLKPTAPVITVTLPDAADLDDPTQDTYEIHVEMDVAQIVDVAIHSVKVSGDAEVDHDYEIEGSIIIPKGETEGVFTLHISSDELLEGPLTLTLQIGDARTANADITPVTLTIDRNP